MAWKLSVLVLAVLTASAGAASAQTVYAATDVIYETPSSAPSMPGASVPSEVTAAAPAPANAVENPASQVHHSIDTARPRAYAAPQTYRAAGFGVHPFLASSRCMVDLGYGRWEACD